MTFDLAIKGGTTVSGACSCRRDIFVTKGRIADIRKPSGTQPKARRVIDARGLHILPGIIDAHTHFHLSLGHGKYNADDFTSGSAAAACGGTTTFMDYTGQGPGESPFAGLLARKAEAEGRCYTDYSFHGMLTGWAKMKDPAGEMAKAVKAGMTTFKMFTAYGARGLMAGDAELFEALETAARLGALVCIHAENGPVIDLLTARYAPARKMAALPLSRPEFTEIESVGRAVQLAAAAGAPVYFVHLSTGGAAAVVAEARRKGLRVIGETCPQYLALSDEKLKGRDGHLYSCCPPLRAKANNAALWRAAAAGTIQVIATDTCTFNKTQKSAWKGDIRALPMGLPGAQTLLAAAYTSGVKRGAITPNRLVELLCENPARIMGLSSKGFIRAGFDADLAIIDPAAATKADWRRMKHNTDYSAWQGMELYGFPKYTVLRGSVIAEAGELVSPSEMGGRFLRRSKPGIL